MTSARITIEGKIDQARGIALLVHGLNLNSERLLAISEACQALDYVVLRLRLSGHRGGYSDAFNGSIAAWRDDYAACEVEIAKLKKTIGQVPCLFIGMSLGALTFIDHCQTSGSQTFHRALFLCPALALRWTSHLLRLPSAWFPSLSVISLSDPHYRVCNKLPLHIYSELYRCLKSVHLKLKSSSFNLKTDIFIHPLDELVSPNGIKKLILNRKLSNANFHVLTNEKKIGTYHLIVDEKSMGSSNWQFFLSVLTVSCTQSDGRDDALRLI